MTYFMAELNEVKEAIERVRELHKVRIENHPKHLVDYDNDDNDCAEEMCINCMRALRHEMDGECAERIAESGYCGCFISRNPCQCEIPIPGCTGWYVEECCHCPNEENSVNSISENYGSVGLHYPCETIKALDGEQE